MTQRNDSTACNGQDLQGTLEDADEAEEAEQ